MRMRDGSNEVVLDVNFWILCGCSCPPLCSSPFTLLKWYDFVPFPLDLISSEILETCCGLLLFMLDYGIPWLYFSLLFLPACGSRIEVELFFLGYAMMGYAIGPVLSCLDDLFIFLVSRFSQRRRLGFGIISLLWVCSSWFIFFLL